jgi:putative PIN family toxin of toxin-antitoxin system
MRLWQIVIDTNVLVSALRSQRGPSYRLFTLVDAGKFEINVSVALVLEYEEVCERLPGAVPVTEQTVDNVIDYICGVANRHKIHYRWRPFLNDAEDDMVLEVAVVASADVIVTYNVADFRGVDQFGIRVLTPREFLREIGDLP